MPKETPITFRDWLTYRMNLADRTKPPEEVEADADNVPSEHPDWPDLAEKRTFSAWQAWGIEQEFGQ